MSESRATVATKCKVTGCLQTLFHYEDTTPEEAANEANRFKKNGRSWYGSHKEVICPLHHDMIMAHAISKRRLVVP